MKILTIFFLASFLFIYNSSSAQTDTTFWFAAPDVDEVNNPTFGQYDRPIYLRLTSLAAVANVKVSLPANPAFIPINIVVPANATSTIDLTQWINLIENFEPNNINNKGILIQSSTGITAYYEVNSSSCKCNPELFALKGKNALGNDFLVSSQSTWSIDTVRHPAAKAAFEIVATQNNTSITITPAAPLNGRPANIPFSINLNRGQSFSCQALYRNGSNLLGKSKIISDKPIAVTTKEDLLFSDGACADLAGDQMVPTQILGKEYAIVRGSLTTRDKAVITATQNNTNIYFNGNGAPVATINAGQSYETDITVQPSLYIQTDKVVNVIHYTGFGCEVGSAIIPKLNCTGSSSVSIVRSNSGNAIVLLVTKNGNQGNFTVNGNNGIITAADFSPLAGTGGGYLFCKKDISGTMPINTATVFANSSGKFQLGFINGDPGGYMYGYFSDFKKSNVAFSQAEICMLDSVELNAFGGTTYQWVPATGLSNPNIANPKSSPLTTTDYKVIITDVDGCADTGYVKILVKATPLVKTSNDTTLCGGGPVQLNTTGATTYSWSPVTGLSNPNIANPVANPVVSTRYIVSGNFSTGCTAKDTFDITIQPKPAITKSRDTSICAGASVQLFATGGTTYTWSPATTLSNPNIANPIATPVASVTKYYVTVINNNINTCSNTDSVKVTLKVPSVFTVSPAQSTCKDTPAQLNATGGDIYLWSPANSVNNAAVANPLTNTGVSTNYSVTITESSCNISQTLFTTVTVNPLPLVSASKSNDIDCSIGFSNLMAGGASQYIWTPSTGLNNAGIANPVARPASTTRYVVTGTNSFGCIGYDSLTVAVTQLGKSLYLMPTSFTPNGDGLNDCFGLKYWGVIENLQFFIYNRYGEKVFSTTDPNKCWDGKYKTEKPEPGNYVYYIKAKTVCGDVERKGNVVLIR